MHEIEGNASLAENNINEMRSQAMNMNEQMVLFETVMMTISTYRTPEDPVYFHKTFRVPLS